MPEDPPPPPLEEPTDAATTRREILRDSKRTDARRVGTRHAVTT